MLLLVDLFHISFFKENDEPDGRVLGHRHLVPLKMSVLPFSHLHLNLLPAPQTWTSGEQVNTVDLVLVAVKLVTRYKSDIVRFLCSYSRDVGSRTDTVGHVGCAVINSPGAALLLWQRELQPLESCPSAHLFSTCCTGSVWARLALPVARGQSFAICRGPSLHPALTSVCPPLPPSKPPTGTVLPAK